MTHYVYLRLRNREHLLTETKLILEKAKAAILGILSVDVLAQGDCLDREINMLVVLSFVNTQSKDIYLAHQLHKEFLQQLKPDILEKAVFDTEEKAA